MAQDVTSALDAVYRSDWGRIVAALIRLFGDFNAAEEAAQEAFAAAAVDQWPEVFLACSDNYAAPAITRSSVENDTDISRGHEEGSR